MKAGLWLLTLFLLSAVDGQSQSTERWFPTGPPELLTSDAALTPPMIWPEYIEELRRGVRRAKLTIYDGHPVESSVERIAILHA